MEKEYKKCGYVWGCENSIYGGGRGYCKRHYGIYYARVRRGAKWEFFQAPEPGAIPTERGKNVLKCRTNNKNKYI